MMRTGIKSGEEKEVEIACKSERELSGSTEMSLSRLSEKCRRCPFGEKCRKKRMEALAIAPINGEKNNMYIDVQVSGDEIKKALFEHLRGGLMELER